jgi:hypothetical protein
VFIADLPTEVFEETTTLRNGVAQGHEMDTRSIAAMQQLENF